MISISPTSELWYSKISGLSENLTLFAYIPTIIISIMPALTVLISFQRATLVTFKETKPITFATIIEVTVIILTLFVSIEIIDLTGIIASMIAFILGRLCAVIYLKFPFADVKNKKIYIP